ncbi:hypothetical protein AAHA92_09731 [Salvia divinorum]|uniref:Retrotransposon gag domain-containing protein n=1 Tax=Salvia divinorum TaxID=28513 RepID=A0ABD1HT83_SALDI
MSRGSRFGRWNNVQNWRDTESNWRIREVITTVSTRSGLSTAETVHLSSRSEEDTDPSSSVKEKSDLFSDSEEERTVTMAALPEDDPEICSLNAHLNGESFGEIVHTQGQARIERRPAGSTEEDYRLRALPFALKGEADTWLMRLPPNSIRTWADYRSVFLDYFFSSHEDKCPKEGNPGGYSGKR